MVMKMFMFLLLSTITYASITKVPNIEKRLNSEPSSFISAINETHVYVKYQDIFNIQNFSAINSVRMFIKQTKDSNNKTFLGVSCLPDHQDCTIRDVHEMLMPIQDFNRSIPLIAKFSICKYYTDIHIKINKNPKLDVIFYFNPEIIFLKDQEKLICSGNTGDMQKIEQNVAQKILEKQNWICEAEQYKLRLITKDWPTFNISNVYCVKGPQLHYNTSVYHKKTACKEVELTIQYGKFGLILHSQRFNVKISSCNQLSTSVTVTSTTTLGPNVTHDGQEGHEDQLFGTTGLVVGIVVGCLFIIIIIGVIIKLKRKKVSIKVEKAIQDDNPYYGSDEYNYEMTEVKDANDTYNNDDGEYGTEVNDKNAYYEG